MLQTDTAAQHADADALLAVMLAASIWFVIWRHAVRTGARVVMCLSEREVDRELARTRSEMMEVLNDGEAMARVHEIAAEHAGVDAGAFLARELVGDVVCDLFDGAVQRCSGDVLGQMIAEVRQRAIRSRRASKLHLSITQLDETQEPTIEAADSADKEHLGRDPVEEKRQRLARARTRLEGDEGALQLLTLYELGVSRKRDVMRTGIPEGRYRAARRRVLAALREDVPGDDELSLTSGV